MNKIQFGALLLILGSVGVLAISLFSAPSWGIVNALNESGLMSIFLVFTVMGIAGLVICVKELFPFDWGDGDDEHGKSDAKKQTMQRRTEKRHRVNARKGQRHSGCEGNTAQ